MLSLGGAPTQSWAYRACVVQGTQQIYVAILWYWGASLTQLSSNGISSSSLATSTSRVTGITTPIALLLWAVGAILYFGLPNYFRQAPGKVPSFYTSLTRRRIVLVSTFSLSLHAYL
jgi:alpha-1,3-glucan synthase